ncbi:MAG: hypothetical protein JWM90_1624 [Thermoleophilia bacterium]|nr:hypothetical protein [Thermoleophilia bacterium]
MKHPVSRTVRASTPASRTSESGVALIWAILIMLVVLGLLVAIGVISVSSARETRDATSRTRAVFWAEAAAKDIVARFDNGEIGPWIAARDATGNEYLSMPLTAGFVTPTTTSFPVTGSTSRALPLVNTVSGVTTRGWYQVLSPVPTQTRPWTGFRVFNPATPESQGSVQFVIRAWNDMVGAKPTTVRIELRRGTLARFSMLSENEFTLGGLGTLTLGGGIHTNNAKEAPLAIEMGTNASLAGVTTVSSTKGAITGCGAAPSKCRPNVGEVVSFGSGNRAFQKVERLAKLPSRCTTTAFVACDFTTGVNAGIASISVMPAWHVYLNGAGGCVTVRTMSFPMRLDTGSYGMLDDRAGPVSDNNSLRTYCPAPGGGALLFNGDVIVSGRRAAGMAPVTIMAQRDTATFPLRTVNGQASQRITAPASIYLLQTGGPIGSASATEPLGLVAQGGIYLPSWAMRTVNSNLNVTNVAAMAVTGEVAYGPSIMAVAADGSAPGGMGILPAQARALGYGYGASFTFSGSLASGGRMTFRYGVNNLQYLGYGTRNIAYVPSLTWNAPPYYPSDSDWHLADWTEFDS